MEIILNDEAVKTQGVDVPAWINQDISGYDIASIQQGGCASGAYMPAVTYHEALATMGEHGDDVMEYVFEGLGEDPTPSGFVWSQLAVHYLSTAVELWACQFEVVEPE